MIKTSRPHEEGFADKIDVKSSNYDLAAAHGYFVKDKSGQPYPGKWWKGQGSLIDFTNPEAKAWWQGQVGLAVKAGADGFKDDDAEGNFQGDARFADGTDPRLMRNRYAVLYNRAMEEVIQNQLHGNGILFIRSATVGNQNLAVLWGGDNESEFLPGKRPAYGGDSGAGCGHQWNGFMDRRSGWLSHPQRSGRPKAFHALDSVQRLFPTMELLSTSNRGPWDYGDEALKNYRKYAVLHMSLFPYRYAAAQEAAKTGMPIMRALVLEYQNDQRAREAKDEYLFGPDLLAAPVIDVNTSRAVYLPGGQWIDYWSGKPLSGGTEVVADAPLDVLPLYARAGAILPKIPEDVMTLVPPAESENSTIKSLDDRRVYELLPAANDSQSVTITDFEGRTVARTAHSLDINGKAAKVTVRWRFDPVNSVTLGDTPLELHTDINGRYVEFDHSARSKLTWK